CTTDYGVGAQAQFRTYESMVLKFDLLSAIQVATSDVSGVMVVCGQEVVAPEHAVIDFGSQRPIVRSSSRKLIGRMQFGFVAHAGAQQRGNVPIRCHDYSPDSVAYI